MAETKSTESQLATNTVETSDFQSKLKREFRPKSDRAQEQVEAAVKTLAEHVLQDKDLISDDAINSINATIAEIDKKLSAQINEILHHADFQQMEGTWRGLKHLVFTTESSETLLMKIFNVSKKELGKTLKRFPGTSWDQSPVFKMIYEEEYGSLGGNPFGCLVGDYYFDHSPQDVELLRGISTIAAASHAPFIAAASPTLMGFGSWQELSNPRDLSGLFTTPEHAAWRSLRESEDARYIGLTLPRFLSRLPYGAKTEPVEEFAFEEDTAAGDSSKYTWSNAAYAMASNINRAFAMYGWCTRIRGVESGGAVDGLPCHTFPSDDGGVDMKCPTEISIAHRREAELAKNGLMPLSHRKNSDQAVFIGAQSLQKPAEFDDAEATANAALAARLPYIFACSRFAHYLKSIVHDKIGLIRERADMERWLSDWILNYVDGNPENSSEEVKARKPLAGAQVEVKDVEGKPGYYSAVFRLRPHYQLEGLTVSLRLVSRLQQS